MYLIRRTTSLSNNNAFYFRILSLCVWYYLSQFEQFASAFTSLLFSFHIAIFWVELILKKPNCKMKRTRYSSEVWTISISCLVWWVLWRLQGWNLYEVCCVLMNSLFTFLYNNGISTYHQLEWYCPYLDSVRFWWLACNSLLCNFNYYIYGR